MGRPPIHPAGTTASDRSAMAAERVITAGGRRLQVMLSPEAAAALAALKCPGEGDKAAVERAILLAASQSPIRDVDTSTSDA